MCCRADALSMTTVDFMTKEDAIQYCERNGILTFKVWNLILLIVFNFGDGLFFARYGNYANDNCVAMAILHNIWLHI